MQKALRSVQSARRLLEDGDNDFAVSRAYYAMFYVAQAALLSRGLTFSKHSAVISAFGKEFVKPGLLPNDLHAAFTAAFDQRAIGDFDVVMYPRKQAQDLLARSEHFVNAVVTFLECGRNGGQAGRS